MKDSTKGWLNGLIGIIIFSGSLPATRLAVMDFDPIFLTAIRATLAAILGFILLMLLKQNKPKLQHLPSLAMSSFGVVIGFPLFTALALQYVTSAHSIVFIGLLPLSTAIFAVIRAGERPQALFWLFSIVGAVVVAGYSAWSSNSTSLKGDLLMCAAVIVCGLGYVDGAKLSRTLGGWQVISWSLLLALPLMLPLTILTLPDSWNDISYSAWLGLAYVSLFSMLLGFVFWYRGLALGGIASVGQLQLLQPFIGLALAALLLNEAVSFSMLLVTAVAVICVAGAKRYAG